MRTGTGNGKKAGETQTVQTKTSRRKEKREMGIITGRSPTGLWVSALVLAAALTVPGVALALTPAGTNITNQATATWTDVNNNPYTQLSNTTTVTVTSVYGVLLTNPGDKTGVPLDNVSYGYRIENTGNATDNYALSAVSVPAWATSIYVDTNQDGIHQGGEPAASSPVQINAGDNAFIVVVVTIPAGTSNGTTATTQLTVTGALGGAEDPGPLRPAQREHRLQDGIRDIQCRDLRAHRRHGGVFQHSRARALCVWLYSRRSGLLGSRRVRLLRDQRAMDHDREPGRRRIKFQCELQRSGEVTRGRPV